MYATPTENQRIKSIIINAAIIDTTSARNTGNMNTLNVLASTKWFFSLLVHFPSIYMICENMVQVSDYEWNRSNRWEFMYYQRNR